MRPISKETIRVAVVIPALNCGKTIGGQLNAVLAQDGSGDATVVVVDNGSTDETIAVVEAIRRQDDRVSIISCPRRGANAARNYGVLFAAADAVLLCDGDDEVAEGWLDAMLNEFQSGADVVTGPILTDFFNDEDTRRLFGFWDKTDPGTVASLWNLRSGWSCNLGFRKEVWSELGGFNERLSLGGDDIDFVVRAQILGFRVTFCVSASVQYRLRRLTLDEYQAFRRQRHYAMAKAAQITYRWGRLAGWPKVRRVYCFRRAALLLLSGPVALFSRNVRARWLVSMAALKGTVAGAIAARMQ